MKKITKIIIVSLVVLSFIFVLASCAMLDKDPIKVAQALEEEKYDTEITADPDDMRDVASEYGASKKGMVWMMSIRTERDEDDSIFDYDDYEYGMLIYCKKDSIAKDLQKSIEKYFEDQEDEEYFNRKNISVERKGKYVFLGSEEIWEDLIDD